MKVLMVGPARSVNGGISAVVNNYYKAGLGEKVQLSYIGTMEDGSKAHKLKVALVSFLTFLRMVSRYDIVHIHVASDVSIYRKIPFIWGAKVFGKKLVIHQHGGNFQDFFYSHCGNIRRKFIKKSLDKADVFLVVADYLGDIFRKIVKPDKVMVLPNAIEMPSCVPEERKENKLLFLGRLCREKGIAELLDAVRELREDGMELELYLGGIWEDERLKEKADACGAYVRQLGWIQKEEKEKYLRECNIFVLPTYFEGLPMSLLEAMAYGCACIASKVGGIPQLIEDYENGILIPPKEKEALKNAVRTLTEDSLLRRKLAGAGRQTVAEGYELYQNVERLVQIYHGLTAA